MHALGYAGRRNPTPNPVSTRQRPRRTQCWMTAPTRPVSRSHAGVVDPAQRRSPVLFSLYLEISRSMTTQFGQFDLGRSITSGALPSNCGTLRPFRLTKFILVGLRYTSELLRQHCNMRLPPANPARQLVRQQS